jgi:SAM-dependent methyltransferase
VKVNRHTEPRRLSPELEQERWSNERAQGELIAAGNEDAWGWTGPAGSLRADRRSRFIERQARLGPGVTCLELGPGTGEFTTRLAATGCSLTGIEISEATAAICRARVCDSADIIIGNIETGEGLAELEFDAIVGVSVLHHVNLAACFERTLSHLRPGGRFAFSEPNMANPQIWLERHSATIKRWRHVTDHETAFRAAELATAFTAAGFVVEVAEPFEFLHPATPERGVRVVSRVERLLERSPLRRFAGSIRIAGHRP